MVLVLISKINTRNNSQEKCERKSRKKECTGKIDRQKSGNWRNGCALLPVSSILYKIDFEISASTFFVTIYEITLIEREK
jgi:hypothetical protein